MSLSPYLNPSRNTIAQPRVALFVTCLADAMRPSIAFATVKLLQSAGCHVEVPSAQTCCGQPAFNSGDRNNTRKIAQQTIAALKGYDYIVGPSGSCIGMLHQYPELFAKGTQDHVGAEQLAQQAYEVTSFLVDVMDYQLPSSDLKAQITYHDSCAGLRELGIHSQPRKLLSQMPKVVLKEMEDSDTCCGFGGTFCIKYPDISNRMVENKAANAKASKAQLLVGGDLGCLMNMAGKLKRQGSDLQTRHIVELLADMLSHPALGEANNTPLKSATIDLAYEA
ncbi:MAG: (Fe-S)-binding protein [Gammaproteobacteria bacterium]|nr:(Fe-S)-binding protein [Gammaproteobacteria bacterium]